MQTLALTITLEEYSLLMAALKHLEQNFLDNSCTARDDKTAQWWEGQAQEARTLRKKLKDESR